MALAPADLDAPLPPPPLAAALRCAVLAHVVAERRRVFAPTLHVGWPGATVLDLALEDGRLDHALRTDAVQALVRALGPPTPAGPHLLAWLTRRGSLEVQDVDLAWASACRSAALELAVDLPMVVVTKQGWHDPRTGAGHTWRRLRPPRG